MILTSWLSAFKHFGMLKQPSRRLKRDSSLPTSSLVEILEDRALLSTFHVSLSGNDATGDGSVATPFRTVQAGINAAAAANDGDDAVEVAQGLYNTFDVDGKISIPASANLSNLELTGGWNATFTARTPQSTIYAPDYTGAPPTGADGDIDVVSPNTTIDGFHFVFDGNGVGGVGGTRISGGIVVQATGVTINDNTIEVGSQAVAGGARSTGIQTASSDTSDLTISNNTITADGLVRSQGIFLNPGVATNTEIIGNTITGSSYAGIITIKERGDVSIVDNVIQRSGAATGFQAIDVRTSGVGTPITNLSIVGNTIDGGGTGTGIHLGDATGAGTQAITDFVIENNVITNHVGSSGILIGAGGSQANNISGTIAYNSITGNTNGIFLSPLTGGTTTIDASRNWWGAISGPTLAANPGGMGDAITGAAPIKFAPWLIYSADTNPALPGVQLPTIVTVTSGGEISAADNDFTRIQNAVGAAADGQTIDIQGLFNWTTPLASAAYLASTNTSTTNDIRGAVIPAGVDNLTITSSTSTGHIIGQGDLLGDIFDSFLFAEDGAIAGNTNLTIQNLNIDDFESAVTMGWNGTGVFNGLTVQDNDVTLAGDNEGTQNIAFYFSYGANEHLTGNTVTFQGDGTRAIGTGARSYGFQNSTTGGTGYDGLVIDGNVFQVGATSNGVEIVYGVWENGHNDDNTSDISITNNQFLGRTGDDFDRALKLSSQTTGLVIDSNTFTDVDDVFFGGDTSAGASVGDQFTFTNNELTRVGGADGIFLSNVSTDAVPVHVRINWNINNTVDGFTGVRGLNELSVQATGDSRPLSAATDLDNVFAVGPLAEVFVDDSAVGAPRFTDSDGLGAGLGPMAVGFNEFTTISDGIAAVDAGGTVYVAAGTYAESAALTGTLTLSLAGDVAVDSLGSVAGTTIDLQDNTLTVGAGNLNDTLAGTIEGTGNLVKTGSGILYLTGADTFTGTTTVNGGTLLVNGSTTSDTTVENLGTLGGTGTINGPVNVNFGGTLTPGDDAGTPAPGILNTGDLALGSGSTFAVDVNGPAPGTEADEVAVTGTVDVTGANLVITGTLASNPGQVITLISNDGADAVVGTFAGLPEGSTVTINGIDYVLSYQGGVGGNDVTLAEPNVAASIDDVTVDEAAGTMVFNIVLDKPLDITFTIDVTFTDVTATGGGVDYTSTTQHIVFLAGETSHQVIVPITNDNIVEGTETFTVALSTATPLGGRFVDLRDTATGTITDNDSTTVSIARTTDGAETDTPTNGQFTVTLAAPSSTDTVVTYAVSGTATPGVDYANLSGTVTIPAGQTSATINVAVLNDNVVEGTESVIITLTGFGVPNAAVTLDPTPANQTATVDITDDDAATFIINNVTVNEADGTLVFDVTTDKALDIPITINVTFTDVTATGGGVDYVSTPQAITFLPGQTSKQVSVAITDDNSVEGSETFTAALSTVTPLGGRSVDVSDTGTGTIVDDGTDEATFTISDATVAEGAGNLVFTITSDKALDTDVTITVTFTDVTATGGGVDYASVTQQVTFLAGQTSKQVSVAINNDTLVEGTETFTAALSSTTPLGGRVIDVTDTATGTITDNDLATVSIAKTTDGAESNAPTNGQFTVTLSSVSTTDTVVNYTVSGTATAGSDYSTLTGTVTIPAGQTTANINVAVLNDAIAEGTESVIVTLTGFGAHNSEITLDPTPANTTATVNITDNDTDTLTISSPTVVEGNAGVTTMTFTVTSPTAVEGGFTVAFNVANVTTNGTDYTVVTTSPLTFTGAAGETQTITVNVNGDTIVEGTETLSVTLGTVVPTGTVSAASVVSGAVGTGTITNDDTNTLTISSPTVVEGNAGTTALTFTVTSPNAVEGGFTVAFNVANVTTNGTDYTIVTSSPITFSGTAGETQTITINVNGDTTLEPTETLTVTLGNVVPVAPVSATSIVSGAVGTGTITNDDAAFVTITKINDGAESNTPTNGKFRVTLSAASPTDTVVTYSIGGTATPGAGQDYTPLSGTVTIPAGQLSADIDVAVLNDSIVEDTETVIVTLTGLGAHDPSVALSGTAASLTATVNITDEEPLVFTSPPSATVPENTPTTTVVLNVDAAPIAGHTITYSLSGPDATRFNINPTTGEITFVTSPDFEAPADQGANNVYNVTVTATADFTPARSASQDLTITVTPVNDNGPVFVDASPTFTVPENSPAGTVVGSVTATDSDSPAQSVTYSIVSGNATGAFAIDPTTGVITVADASQLNFEGTNQFTITVRATENGDPTRFADAVVTVNVTNVVESPTITIPNTTGIYTIGQRPIAVADDATFTYGDVANPDFSHARLTVSIVAGRQRGDRLSVFPFVSHEDNGIALRGRKVFRGGEQIGKLTRGTNHHPDLVVQLYGNATSADIEKLMQRVNFLAKRGVGTTRTISMQVTNIGGVDSNVATRNIAVVN